MSAIKNRKPNNFLQNELQVGQTENNKYRHICIGNYAFLFCVHGWRSIGHLFHGTRVYTAAFFQGVPVLLLKTTGQPFFVRRK